MNPTAPSERDRNVLMVVAIGLIAILLGIIIGIFTSPRALPNWAENVLISIASVTGLKLGDCLSTLVALAGGRSVERLGAQLGQSVPATSDPTPQDAADAAGAVADAAAGKAGEIAEGAQP